MKIVILHLDLGIGGAERLIVNLAVSMLDMGHDVTILTSHHDRNHCFEETSGNGILSDKIKVYGDWLPRTIFGKFTAMCAILRMCFLAIMLFSERNKVDVVLLDGVSAPIPIMQNFGLSVLFYCHFPDKLLCTERSNILKRLYRTFVIDFIEDATVGCANVIAVNSAFTAKEFRLSFPRLGKTVTPEILYPTVTLPDLPYCHQNDNSNDNNNNNNDECKASPNYSNIDYIQGYNFVFLSLNRFERKKSIDTAIHAFHTLLLQLASTTSTTGAITSIGTDATPPNVNVISNVKKVLLVIAGGYDKSVPENVEYHLELVGLANKLSVQDSVIFRLSISTEEKNNLLQKATALLYTPANEHFGIVPLEAMSYRCPVIAVNSGGPLETVRNNVTGYLVDQTPEAFSEAMRRFTEDRKRSRIMGQAGRILVTDNFSAVASKNALESLLQKAQKKENQNRVSQYMFFLNFLLISLFGAFVAVVGATYFALVTSTYHSF